MGKIKADDKSSIPGNSCKTENKCRRDNAFSSVISSISKKSGNDDVRLPKNDLNIDDETFDPQSAKVKGAGMSRVSENRTISSRSILRKMTKTQVAESEERIFTTKVKVEKEMVTSMPGSSVASKSKSEVASSKQQLNGESSGRCSDDEQPTFKRLKPISLPAVHIHRLSTTEPALLSLSDSDRKHHSVERKPSKTVSIITEETNLSGDQHKSCELLDSPHFDEISVKNEPDPHSALAVDIQKTDIFKVKQENDYEDGCSAQVADVTGAERKNEKASGVVVPVLTKSCNELKSPKVSTDRTRSKYCNATGEGLMENVAVSDDSSCNDVVVLSVDSSRSKTARKSRSDVNRKRSGTDDNDGCSITMPIKREPCAEQDAATADFIAQDSSKVDERAFIRGTPNKIARTSSKNVGAKSAKKTRPAKSKQSTYSGSSVSLSVLTRSMIKIPG